MENNLTEIANQIDTIIRHERLWFDFTVFHYDGRKLIIAGSDDLTYYHQLEVIFEDVFFFSGYFDGWKSETQEPVFILPDAETALALNIEYEIVEGYHLFIFKTEDYRNDVIIAAGNVSFNTDTVLYYFREDLQENQRLAHFVKRKER
ncbi:hypothetical protein L3C95_18410 [Chitinophaga filiformis]|uniref:hypothetical protein n=1 Tax=Chitinophaga filiformis TaxID=104663 RepID=UPI001F301FC3|nr:hypothetical protein [Chitinophaga filiformis]MCF6404879.1 hypothetical protein [Chitinophaga filiformis]